MKVTSYLSLEGGYLEVVEALRAYFVGEGYTIAEESESRLEFLRAARPKLPIIGPIENYQTQVQIDLQENEWAEQAEDRDSQSSAKRTSMRIEQSVKAPWKLLTRIDQIYLESQVDALRHYYESGHRDNLRSILKPLRSPIRAALIMNLLLTSVLIMAAGLMAELNFGLIVTVLLAVIILNAVSILGFADIIIEACEGVFRRSK